MADDTLGTGLTRSLQEEMQTSYMEYAMSVIISRALPEVRDGLKPVQRRILYAMQQAGATSASRYRKCAAFVGDVLKLYHPHGDTSVYDALVRMAQEFSLRYPLIDGQGNFGSVDGDPPAAMRYTEARLSAITGELMADIEKRTVDMRPNYDGSEEEPTVLPARLPNLLVNGASGIAVGMTTNIPPHNLREICAAVKHLIENPEATGEDLLEFVKGPDFPTGGIIMGTAGIKQAYSTGHGRIVVRARHTFEQAKNGRERIIIDELPYAVNKAALVAKIAELVSERRLEGIADLRDESDRQGMRIVIELKREAQVFAVLNNLYKHTSLQQTFGVIILASDQKVRMLIKEETDGVVKKYGDDRRTEITDQEPNELSAEDLVPKEEVVVTLTHRGYVKRQPLRVFRAQKRGGVGLKGARPTAGGEAPSGTREEDYAAHLLTTHTHASMLFFTQSGRVFQLRVHEVPERERQAKGVPVNNLIDIGGNERITSVFVRPETETEAHYMLMVTKNGYIKKTALREYANVRRNGLIAINLQEGDELDWVTPTTGEDQIIIATALGKAIRFSEAEVRAMGRDTQGVIGIKLGKGDSVAGMGTATPGGDVLVITERGYGKRTPVSEYPMHHRAGQGVFTLKVTDRVGRLSAMRVVGDPEDEVLIISTSGMVLRTPVGAISQIGRQTQGVIVMRVAPDDQVVAIAPVGAVEEGDGKE